MATCVTGGRIPWAVYFLTTAIDHALHALGARMAAEALPLHVLKWTSTLDAKDGRIDLLLDPGHGTAPDAEAHFTLLPERSVDGPWRSAFSAYGEMLAHCVP